MKIIDTHCDALLKLQSDKRETYMFKKRNLNFSNSSEIDTNAERLKAGNVKVQFFAIFLSPAIPDNEKWQHALEQVDCFYDEILTQPNMVHIKHLSEINDLKDDEIGAVLTLEGSDAFGNDLMKLKTLFRLGVLSLGLTWNNANLVADGVGEKRLAGLTNFGFDVIDLCNEYGVLVDVSHLNENGFNDIIDRADRVFASHSNSRAVMDHLRNLTDSQITQIIEKGGMINLVFNPPFIKSGDCVIEDLFPHIDRIIDLGGTDHIGLGSDFDGIFDYVKDLGHAGEYPNFVAKLEERYGHVLAEKITHLNFQNNFC
ncbi:dipeptidase [Aliicoccus persicus]|uniref:Dipeptidase. Metallo peptidase. MEROPS family M19 n=1 Tax=Aliicoccus persicus TaxID=930138 RepID=A0A662Z565_9STAP|nr:dipeptidase [Aliicoccus persicus]SEV87463.1 dipeptidase. Metallo peptidase. MEROPS family M19 [Aliicoccus persicus]